MLVTIGQTNKRSNGLYTNPRNKNQHKYINDIAWDYRSFGPAITISLAHIRTYNTAKLCSYQNMHHIIKGVWWNQTIVMTTPYVLRYPLHYAPVDLGELERRDAQHHANLIRFQMSKVHPLNRCLGDGSQPHCYTHVHTGHPMLNETATRSFLVPSQMDITCSTPKPRKHFIILY